MKAEHGLCFELTPENRPLLIRAGFFRIGDRNFETEYCLEDFHALHLYAYSGSLRTATECFELAPGDLTLTPAGTITSYALEPPGTHLCIHFELAPQGNTSLPFHWPTGKLPERLTDDLTELVALFRCSDDPEKRTAAENLLLSALFRLKCQPQHTAFPDRRISRLLYELDRSSDSPVCITALAQRFAVSQTHLTRKFRQQTGMTIARYVMHRRIDKARYLLAASNLSIKEIGTAVGYATPQEFNKRFRQLAGVSPSAYRQKERRPISLN
ncbi:AraC family transcriptional regulator [Victivallis sp. Marseille-Q1083]|uniref:AraC family transcriptional regulator n=1 Tax=Victivallis sp. Marseille-Q1083 TaxID=2717288 RepID=UPI00158B156C|nr:AraC family transcriptional regulator [Victivallis sp. Marseille-Q1083]